MPTSRFSAVLATVLTISAAFAQTIIAQSAHAQSASAAMAAGSDDAKEPKLERFDPNLVDQSLDPCNDFYKYSCNKWLTANPDSSRPGFLEHR